MRLLTSIISFVVITAAVVALVYTGRTGHQSHRDSVGVTINPIFDLVKQVAGSDVPVELIVPAGADPHNYEPDPTAAATIESSRVIFAVGHGFDDWITKQTTEQPVVTLDKNIDLIESGGEDDPHYFLSPANASLMVGQIADTLAQEWPDFAINFQTRASNYQAQLNQTVANYQPRFANRNLKIATFHNAFNYLARDFGVDVVATFEEYAGQTPSPAWLVDFQSKVRANKLTVIYAEPSFPRTSLEPVAADLGVTIGELDPLENSTRHSDYLSALEDNLETLLSQP